MPITPEARFDGTSRGWCVFEVGSSHHPTVTNGRALILYLLPNGKIDFADR
ncbi:MAG: 4-hydroxylaminobenzoate lyase [Desulfobacterales bacterium]